MSPTERAALHPATDAEATRIVRFIHGRLTDEEVDRVAAAVVDFFGR